MRDLEQLESTLAELTAINRVRDADQETRDKIDQIRQEISTEKIVRQAFELTVDNANRETLNKNTATTQIIDNFCKSNKKFLVFHDWTGCIGVVQPIRRQMCVCGCDLIVIRCPRSRDFLFHSNHLTMTQLKKASGTPLWIGHPNELSKGGPTEGLMHELSNLPCRKEKGEEIAPFSIPVLLGGQTYANQSGYGSEYHGYRLVRQGTLYGETTDFLIIGARISCPI